MKLFALTIFFILVLGLSGFLAVNAQEELNLQFTPPCPTNLQTELGECPPTTDIGSYIIRIYQFGVGISGILAVGMIVAGAIYYSVSAGSPDKQNDAKSMITSALWGVALLLGSFLILNTINPEIVALKSPGVGLPDCPTPLEGQRPGIDCLPEPRPPTPAEGSPRLVACAELIDPDSESYCRGEVTELTGDPRCRESWDHGLAARCPDAGERLSFTGQGKQYPYFRTTEGAEAETYCYMYAYKTRGEGDTDEEFREKKWEEKSQSIMRRLNWAPC